MDDKSPPEPTNKQVSAEAMDTQVPAEAVDTQVPAEAMDTQVPAEAMDTQVAAEAMDTQVPAEAMDTQVPAEAMDTQVPAEAMDTQVPAEAVDTQVPAEAMDTQVPAEAMDTQVPAEAMDTQVPAEAMDTQVPAEAMDTQVPAEAMDTQVPAEAVDTQVPAEAMDTQVPAEAMDTQVPAEAMDTQVPAEAVDTQVPAEAMDTQVPAEAMDTQVPAEAMDTQVPAEAMDTQVPAEAMDTQVPAEAMDTQVPAEAMDTQVPAEAMDTQVPAEAMDTQVPAEAMDTQVPAEAMDTQVPAEAMDTQVPAEAMDTQVPAEAMDTQVPAEAMDTQVPAEAMDTQVPAEAMDTQVPAEAVDTQVPAEAMDTQVPAEAMDTQVPAEAMDTQVPAEAMDTQVPAEAMDTQVPAEAMDTQVPAEAMDTQVPAEAMDTQVPAEAMDTQVPAEAVDTQVPAEAMDTQVPAEAMDTQVPAEAMDTQVPAEAMDTQVPAEAMDTQVPAEAMDTQVSAEAMDTQVPAEAMDTQVPAEAMDTQVPAEAMDTQVAAEAMDTQVPAEAMDTQVPAEAMDTQVPAEAMDTQVPAEAMDTQVSAEAMDTQVPAEAMDTQVAAEAMDTQVPAEAMDTQVPAEAMDTQVPAEAMDTQVAAEAMDTQVSAEAMDTQVSAEAMDTQVPAEAMDTQVPAEAMDTQVAAEAMDTQVIPLPQKRFSRADPIGLRPPETPRDFRSVLNYESNEEDRPLPSSRRLPPPRLRPMGGAPEMVMEFEVPTTAPSGNGGFSSDVSPESNVAAMKGRAQESEIDISSPQELFSSTQTRGGEVAPLAHDLRFTAATNELFNPQVVDQQAGLEVVGSCASQVSQQFAGMKRVGDGTLDLTARSRNTHTSGAGVPLTERSQERPVAHSVEQLCRLQTMTRPVERFFVEYQPMLAKGCRSARVPVEEDEALFNHLAEYTDDDSFFSSGSAVLQEDTRRLQKDPLRGRAIRSVFETLSLRSLTKGRMPHELEDQERSNAPWLKQVHQRAIAIHHSSFFLFPAGMKARVVAYNILHHWLTEMLLILVIFVYSIMTAAWSRDTWPELEKPGFMLFADVFFLCIYAIEFFARLFTSGGISHPRAYFRSSWHWLDTAVLLLMILNCTNIKSMWNFSAFRLIRVLKSCTYVPIPMKMKLLAKSLLRSTVNVVRVSTIIFYVLLFFSLVGLQVFSGALNSRCINPINGSVTNLLCRFNASDKNTSYYQGATCPLGHLCVSDRYGSPHHGYRTFDTVGNSFLTTFQIMTFQGWTSLLQEISDTTSVGAIAYFVLTILVCAWVIPSLYLGVFIEKIEKTRRLFVQKQLQLFDGMLLEQRQRLNEAIRLRDFVERDEFGKLRRHPIERLRSATRRIENPGLSDSHTSITTDSDIGEVTTTLKMPSGDTTRNRSRWTDEQRVQLHLSLTRQRNIASGCDRKRRVTIKNANELNEGTTNGRVEKRDSETIGERPMMVTGDFALGGRVGVVQHHPLTHTIGAAHGSDLPLAVRLDNEEEQLKFLKDYQNTIDGDLMKQTNNTEDTDGSVHPSFLLTGTEQGTDGVNEVSKIIRTTTEAAGVIPNRCSISAVTNNTSHIESKAIVEESLSKTGPGRGEESTLPRLASGQVPEVIIHDPEGGDFRFANTLSQKWGIVRNILHMFTEGYPRIITQYIREHRRMQRRFGLTPLNYVNKYEDDVLRKIRQRRVLQVNDSTARSHMSRPTDGEELVEMGGKKFVLTDSDDIGDLSPIQMANNIVRNVPLTPFGVVMLVVVILNGIFNAARHFDQPEDWEMALFIISIVFTSCFVLEIVVRVVGLGLIPFFVEFNNFLDVVVTILGLVELSYARSNVITVLNWVRLLRFFRALPFAPMRRVARVLFLGLSDMLYALFFFSIYMFMWILIGMSFFGGPNGKVDQTFDDYYTRGNFDTFAGASFAVSQAFSYTREEWLLLTWNGMQSRGGYTVLYFMASVFVAFIARYFFVAVFAWAWQSGEEEEESYAALAQDGPLGQRVAGPRLRWFDFTVWRSFKHIHGGFERRDVAPDEVFHLNEDMRKQLRIAEAKERFSKETLTQTELNMSQRPFNSQTTSPSGAMSYSVDASSPMAGGAAPRYFSVGGQLQRHVSPSVDFVDTQTPPLNAPISQFQAENAQLRFARRYSTVPASVYTPVMQDDGMDRSATSTPSTPTAAREQGRDSGGEGVQNGRGEEDGQYSPREASPSSTGGGATAERLRRKSSILGRFSRLEYDGAAGRRDGGSRSVSGLAMHHLGDDEETIGDHVNEGDATGGSMIYEHILFPGPRLRYKHVMRNQYTRAFERCLDCNTYQQMPLRAPPNVQQRSPEELHAEHCHMAAVRSSRQLILNAIMGYVRLQKEINQPPTRDAVETVLGQAWSCGMLLFETIEYLSCSDIEQRECRTWDRTLEALQLQQWLIGLHVGEEQVGRATLAYTLAHRKREKLAVQNMSFEFSWRHRSLGFIPPQHRARVMATNIVQSRWFGVFILTVVFVSSFCLCFHVPGKDNDASAGFVILRVFDGIFTCVFLVEMILKWVSMGVILSKPDAYFWHSKNVFNFVIVVASLIGLADQFSKLRSIKVLRCFEVLIPLRVSNMNRGLSKISSALFDCVPTVANILLLFFINYFVWAVMALRLFNGLTHSCSDSRFVDKSVCVSAGHQWIPKVRNFDNFFGSFLTMVEVSVGSNWFEVIYTGVDGWSSEHAPSDNYHLARGFFFIAYYYVSHLTLFSLFTASMIYSYLLTKNAAEGVLGITFEHQLWIRMQRMTLQLKPRVKLVPLTNALSHTLHKIVIRPLFEVAGAIVLILNIVTMSLHWYGESEVKKTALDALQYVFVVFFTVEALMKFGAHGMLAFSRWAFSFDFFVLLLSFVQLAMEAVGVKAIPFNVSVLRMLRLGRFFASRGFRPLVRKFSLLHEVLVRSAVSVVNVTLVLFLGVFIFTILGLHLIGGVPVERGGYLDDRYTNFNNFGNSLMMTFRLTTLENWSPLLREGMNAARECIGDDCRLNYWSPIFCVLALVILALVFLSLYTAVIVDHYTTAARMNTSITRIEDLRRFRDLWSEFDPNGALVLRARQLPKLLEYLRPPLGLSSRHNRAELLRLLREYDIPVHRGRVHYHEVLLPLARRVLAMAFSRDTVDYRTTFETLWRHSEKSLRALPTVLTKRSHATAAQHFAASYVQAVCRRKKACREVQQVRSNHWHEGRAVCDELGLPYADYGFGSVPLDGPDPMGEHTYRHASALSSKEKGLERGTGASEGNSATSPMWWVGQAESPASPQSDGGATDGITPAARLPGVYHPATEELEKRFGPDVPNAVRRHETRSEKLRRKDEERQLQSTPDEIVSSPTSNARSGSQRVNAGDYQPPLGTDPTSWLSGNVNRGSSLTGPTTNSRTGSIVPVPQGPTAPE